MKILYTNTINIFPFKMFLPHLGLFLCLVSSLASHPMKAKEKSDPGDYLDLTKGLTDAEVESTLNGLSLEDLKTLNKLLDDAGNGPINVEASLRGHHGQAHRKPHLEDAENADEDLNSALNSAKQAIDENCHDEEDLEIEKCEKPPTCPTTKRCTSTRKCVTSACQAFDGLMNSKKYSSARSNKMKYRKLNSKANEDCDPEDAVCLRRNRERVKQASSFPDFSKISMDQDANNIDSLEKLAAEARHDEAVKMHKELDGWQSKDDSSYDILNMDTYKIPNVHINGKRDWAQLKDTPAAQSEDEAKQPFERHQLARVAHEHDTPPEEKTDIKPADTETFLEDNAELNGGQAAPQLNQEGINFEPERESGESQLLSNNNNMAANGDDSFIAINARDPQRYQIQTDDGIINSENEQGKKKLHSDRLNSEMLNYANYQLSKEGHTNHYQLQVKRHKREEKLKTDDAPENTNESYLEKLMDSFPRDQVSLTRLNVAIRRANLCHLRVKRRLFLLVTQPVKFM